MAILFGTYLNNPWTLAPIYLAGTSLGCLLLGVSSEGLDAIDWELDGAGVPARASGRRCGRTCGRSSIGNTLWAPRAAWSGYFVLRRFLERRARSAQRRKAAQPVPEA